MRLFHSVAALLLIPGIFASGCAGLDTSARAEGTGIQVIGAIVVLARHQASQRQKAAAERQARQVFVERALKPAYEARARKLKAAASRGSSGRRPSPGGAAAPPTRAEEAAAKATAELAALSASWRSAAASYTGGTAYAADFAAPRVDASASAEVAFPKMSESDVLVASAAYVPRYLAVTVPAEQAAPGARASVMLWDTRTHRLASDTVYALGSIPPTDKQSEIDGKKVQFAAPRRAAHD